MKSFATFISESVSNAAKQAKKLGLKGDVMVHGLIQMVVLSDEPSKVN
ncbi:MAG: hypothetical protein CM15mV2_2190 [uncultured marine virus]|nr:MAG: hypothetical protein CM15mV2_2190 [uncultured marine virus]